MKINESSLNNSAAAELTQARQAEQVAARQDKRSGAAAGPGESDRINLSELSSRLLRSPAVEPADRAARIERLTAEVRAGRYEPDALAVSRSMIEEALVHGN